MRVSRILPLLLLLACAAGAEDPPVTARGTVFHDADGDGERDPGEAGLPGVAVSNQREIVVTDVEGRWELPASDDCIFFVIKPRGWRTRLNRLHLPRFYYIHKPKGSPQALRHPGVKPTGPLPKSIDFPLVPQEEPDRFRAVFFGDPQPRDQAEVDFIAHDVVEELVGTDAAFGVTLGDIVFDDLSLFLPLARAVALIGIPWYHVIGNHDINAEAAEDRYSDETFERVFGPTYYSFDYGPTHFLVLDDIQWGMLPGDKRPRLRGGFGATQLEFVRNDLARVPREQLVVLMMHIPLAERTSHIRFPDASDSVQDREELFRLIEDRPYCLSIAAHQHYQEHLFLDGEDGWRGEQPHHHVVNVTVCGDWWKGAPDETGIPHATMRDGAPNGYSIFTFDGAKYEIEFKAARRPADWQMAIHAPEKVARGGAEPVEVLVNVFGGSPRTTVEMRVGPEGSWVTLEKFVGVDPQFARAKREEDARKPAPGRPLSQGMPSPHLWRGTLPAGLPKGVHAIEVRARSPYAPEATARRAIRVE